jgi:hypothetical protein
MNLMRRPAVVIALAVCVTWLVTVDLLVVAWLAYSGKGTEAVSLVTTSLLVPVIAGLWSKVSQVEVRTNGENAAKTAVMIDLAKQGAGLPPTAPPTEPPAAA